MDQITTIKRSLLQGAQFLLQINGENDSFGGMGQPGFPFHYLLSVFQGQKDAKLPQTENQNGSRFSLYHPRVEIDAAKA